MWFYADDLLVFIPSPATSIPLTSSILNQFGHVSGYKLNLHKSELFPVNGMALTSELDDLPFKVVENKFTYLGITVTSKRKNLFKENFLSLLNHVKQWLTQWSRLSTSLVGQINSVKKTILPFYTFSNRYQFSFLNPSLVLYSYIWRGKHPRLNKSHQQKSKRSGGMALPNFRLYYWAANIHAVIFWSQTDGPDWVADELNAVQNLLLNLAQILTSSPSHIFQLIILLLPWKSGFG